jgi:hypothetical protein
MTYYEFIRGTWELHGNIGTKRNDRGTTCENNVNIKTLSAHGNIMDKIWEPFL